MIPVASSVPSRHPPVTVWFLILINTIIFGIELGFDDVQFGEFATTWGIVPLRFTQAEFLGDYIYNYTTFFTSLFIHGGWLHVILNMWFLWIFGHNVEDLMGARRFALFYLLCGFLSGAVCVIFSPITDIPTVGASGAIAGILGAYFILFPRARLIVMFPLIFIPIFFSLPAFAYLVVWFLIQYANTVMPVLGITEESGVAWWAHVGGFISGVALSTLFVPHWREHRQWVLDRGNVTGIWMWRDRHPKIFR